MRRYLSMKKSFVVILLFAYFFSFSQQKQFNISWKGHRVLETAYSKIEIPAFNKNHFSYDAKNGLRFFSEWKESGLVNESSASISNIVYEQIPKAELRDLDLKTITSSTKEFHC